jgi:myosin heavy subunit
VRVLFVQCICAGASQQDRLKWFLQPAASFRILTLGGCLDVDGADDAEDYAQLRDAMTVLNFSLAEAEEIMRATVACLHLGNLDFQQNSRDEASIKSTGIIDLVAQLLQVDASKLATSLVSQRKMMGRESILTLRSQFNAEASRDALTKTIYSNMFNALIQRINKTLSVHAKGANRIVGVLDIFG